MEEYPTTTKEKAQQLMPLAEANKVPISEANIEGPTPAQDPREWLERKIVGVLTQIVEQVELVDSGADEKTPPLDQAKVTWAVAHGQSKALCDQLEGMPIHGMPLRLTTPLRACKLLYKGLGRIGPAVVAATDVNAPALLEAANLIGTWLGTIHTALLESTSNKRRNLALIKLRRKVKSMPRA
jgi:hypothetical protein